LSDGDRGRAASPALSVIPDFPTEKVRVRRDIRAFVARESFYSHGFVRSCDWQPRRVLHSERHDAE